MRAISRRDGQLGGATERAGQYATATPHSTTAAPPPPHHTATTTPHSCAAPPPPHHTAITTPHRPTTPHSSAAPPPPAIAAAQAAGFIAGFIAGCIAGFTTGFTRTWVRELPAHLRDRDERLFGPAVEPVDDRAVGQRGKLAAAHAAPEGFIGFIGGGLPPEGIIGFIGGGAAARGVHRIHRWRSCRQRDS